MTGPDLATTLRRSRPDLRVLLICIPLALVNEWNLLQKPFTAQAFLDKVYEILSLRLSPSTQRDPSM